MQLKKITCWFDHKPRKISKFFFYFSLIQDAASIRLKRHKIILSNVHRKVTINLKSSAKIQNSLAYIFWSSTDNLKRHKIKWLVRNSHFVWALWNNGTDMDNFVAYVCGSINYCVAMNRRGFFFRTKNVAVVYD